MVRDPQVLEKLLLVQSSLYLMQDRKHLAEFMVGGLDFLPGMSRLALCLDGETFGDLPAAQQADFQDRCLRCQELWNQEERRPECVWEQRAGVQAIEVQSLSRSWGVMLFFVRDAGAFEVYRSDLTQLSNLVALLLENEQRRKRLEQENNRARRAESDLHQLTDQLERRVEEATAELQREITKSDQMGVKLVESQWSYRRLVENLRGEFFFYRRDLRGRVTYVSPSVADLLGYAQAEFLGLPESFVNQSPVRYRFSPGVGGVGRTFVQLGDRWGRERSFEVHESRWADEHLCSLQVEGIARDVTEQQIHQAQLAARNRILGVMNRFTLLTLEHSGPIEPLAQQLAQLVREGLAEPEEAGVRLQVDSKSYQAGRWSPQGARVSEPLSGGDKEWGRLTVTYSPQGPNQIDAEERQLVLDLASRLGLFLEQQANRAQLLKLSTAVSQSPTPLVLADAQGIVEYVNPAYVEVSGKEPEEVLGKLSISISELNPRERAELFDRLRRGKRWTASWRSLRDDGEELWKEVSCSPVYDPMGVQRHILLVLVDVTEKRKHELALQEALEAAEVSNRAKSAFLATMSHELRTPMNGILGLSGLLLEEAAEPEMKEQAGIVYESSLAMVEVLDELLDVARLESGRFELFVRPIDLRALVLAVQRLFSGAARAKGLELKVEVDPKLPQQIMADPLALNQILSNLLSNAFKFTPVGEVGLGVKLEPSPPGRARLLLKVWDTGVGIDEAYREDIFNLFTQEDNSATRPYGGVGLGLTIVKRLVDMMGGEVRIDSQKEEGSKLEVRLDLALPNTDEPREAEASGSMALPLAYPFKVLLVEDDHTSQEVMEHLLKRMGAEVSLAKQGEEALKMLRLESFDLVLMDCLMPIMDGYEATRQIRWAEQVQGGHLPIIALTAQLGPENIQACKSVGMDGFLAKPIVLEDLYQAVIQVLPVLNPEN